MTAFYNQARPIIENGKLVFVTNGGSRAIVDVRQARKTLAALDSKDNLKPSSIAMRDLYRAGIALWDANR